MEGKISEGEWISVLQEGKLNLHPKQTFLLSQPIGWEVKHEKLPMGMRRLDSLGKDQFCIIVHG